MTIVVFALLLPLSSLTCVVVLMTMMAGIRKVKGGKWRAEIMIGTKMVFLGQFKRNDESKAWKKYVDKRTRLEEVS